jgi:hypothetical protein
VPLTPTSVRGKQNQAKSFVFFSFVFSSSFFSFPGPPRREEKNGASKRDCTEIRVKIGCTKRPDFAPAAAGWGKQNQVVDLLRLIALFFLCYSPLFFLSPTRRGGWKKTVLRKEVLLKFK